MASTEIRVVTELGKRTVLVTGAGGQLGVDLGEAFAGYDLTLASRSDLDIADADATVEAIMGIAPDLVVNAAAYTAVDACETEIDHAFAVNHIGVRNVVGAAEIVGATVLHVSTDYVFDGTKPSPYVETDPVTPASIYGASKAAGESELRDIDCVVRTSWVSGAHGDNMVKTILRLGDAGGELSFVDDQIGNPTFTVDLALAIRRLADESASGVFHVTNQGAVSWYEFAREVLDAAGHDPARVSPVATADLLPARPAMRPANSVLENKALLDGGFELLDDFRVPLAALVNQLQSN